MPKASVCAVRLISDIADVFQRNNGRNSKNIQHFPTRSARKRAAPTPVYISLKTQRRVAVRLSVAPDCLSQDSVWQGHTCTHASKTCAEPVIIEGRCERKEGSISIFAFAPRRVWAYNHAMKTNLGHRKEMHCLKVQVYDEEGRCIHTEVVARFVLENRKRQQRRTKATAATAKPASSLPVASRASVTRPATAPVGHSRQLYSPWLPSASSSPACASPSCSTSTSTSTASTASTSTSMTTSTSASTATAFTMASSSSSSGGGSIFVPTSVSMYTSMAGAARMTVLDTAPPSPPFAPRPLVHAAGARRSVKPVHVAATAMTTSWRDDTSSVNSAASSTAFVQVGHTSPIFVTARLHWA